MAKKQYYPQLVHILLAVCAYIAKYRPQLTKFLTTAFGEEAVAAMDAVVVACEAFTAIVTLTENP